MADDPTAPSLNLTSEEKRVFGQLFRQADTENLGVVTGEVAVKFFEKTRLEPRILGEIWQIADTENRGLLTPAGFGIVLRLIGHYQAGRDPTPELALQPGPLPKFEGGAPGGPNTTIQAPPGPPPSAVQAQTTGSGPIRVPPLTPEKVNQYAALFEKSGAQNGVLPGEQAKQIFERAGLPNEILGRIWNLADTEQRGALVSTEFVIAMHLLASVKSGAMRSLPNILPAGLYEAAARRAPSRQASGINAMSAIPRQFSGAGRAGSPLSRTAYGASQPLSSQGTGVGMEWAITPGDKQKFDGIYATLDRNNKGFITGDEAVPFFSESKLPEEALAQIWDLADINSEGRLTRDEFAVAMYLIRQQRSRQDGRTALPDTLPPNLIPPSMRNQARPTQLPTAPAFDNPAPSMPKSAADDLFGLDALAAPVPAPAPQVKQSTGGSGSFAPTRPAAADPFGQPMTPTSPIQHSPQQSTMFKPFAPSSSFGQSLSHNATGGSYTSGGQFQQRGIPPQPSASEDLLGDNDPEISNKLTSETTELANLSNQVGTLSTQMQEVQGQRSTFQNELNQASTQKREFELRLAQLRSLYEQEAKDVKILREKLTVSRNETKKLQTEMAMLEGTYQDLQVQHRDIATALQADQQENGSLKERMRVINAEITQLKPSLEKLRSDARQQKGLVAINRKQLATIEQEREKLKTEASELNRSIEEDTRALAATPRAQSPTAQVASPALSTTSANNPFFRRQGSSVDMGSSPYAASPAVAKQPERSFEDVFGPSFGAAATSEPPPATSFGSERGASPIPTSTNRETPELSVPPPPPQSRQISSSFLPFPEHSESVSSSRQVSAPNSRFGDSTGADTPTGFVAATPTGSSAAGGQVETLRGQSPELDRIATASPAASEPLAPIVHTDSIPGAFPGDSNSQIMATPTGESTISEAADPFAGMGNAPVRSATAKDDFDAAFAGFGGPAKKQEPVATGSSNDGSAIGAPISAVHKEFPPIAELDDDDDDESDSGSDGGGFDDDFNPSSPAHTRKQSEPADMTLDKASEGTASGANNFLAPRPELTSATSGISSVTTDPPTPGAQISPPTYDKAVSPTEQAQLDLQQYSGLLPKREDPLSSSTVGVPAAASIGQASFGAPATSNSAPTDKVPFDDDFDNDFDDLEDAKEGDLDDDFGNLSVHDRSGMDDFNAVFDNPQAPAKEGAHSDDFGSGNSGFGDFTQSPHPVQQQSAETATVNDNHDWDAIFAGLDQPGTEAPTETAPDAAHSESPERPQIGRAITEAGEHDDPILKNLTGMGYPRNDALAALEKYDYNLERAANYLASQS